MVSGLNGRPAVVWSAASLCILISSIAVAEPTSAQLAVRADGIPEPLEGRTGNAARGRELFQSRDANCSLCHLLPGADPRLMGNIGPAMDGVGNRWTPAELRLRLVDPKHFNPATVMPSYVRTEGLHRVAAGYAGKPILDAQQIEDLVAFLSELR